MIFNIFNHPVIYDAPIAYPRSSGNFGLSVNYTKYKKIDVMYLEGQFGKNIPLITLIKGNTKENTL